MKSEIVKVKRGPVGPNELTFEQSTEKLKSAGWEILELGEELYCNGTLGSNFEHTYKVTLLCTKPNE